MTLAEGIARLDRMARALPAAMRGAEQENGQALLAAARQHSHGAFSSRMLAAMGHPYSRRHRRARLDPGVINIQSGRFAASWALLPPALAGGVMQTIVLNHDLPVADFLASGTRRMIARPLPEKVLGENEAEIDRRRDAALRRLLGR